MRVATFLLIIISGACCSPKYTSVLIDHTTNYIAQSNGDRPLDYAMGQAAKKNFRSKAFLKESEKAAPLAQTAGYVPTELKRVEINKIEQRSKDEQRKLIKQIKNDLEVYTRAIKNHNDIKGDPLKNDAAVTGFLCSLGGLLFFPISFIGLYYCIVGLKSEKRKLAMAGLVLALIPIAALLVLLIFLLSGGLDLFSF